MYKHLPFISERGRGTIHSTKISGNVGLKLNGLVWSNWKRFRTENIGPPCEVDRFSRLDQSDRNGPFHSFIPIHYQSQYLAVWYFPRTVWRKTLIMQLLWIVKGLLTADPSVSLVHPCAVTTALELLRKASVCFGC